jgi:hypothetical protein
VAPLGPPEMPLGRLGLVLRRSAALVEQEADRARRLDMAQLRGREKLPERQRVVLPTALGAAPVLRPLGPVRLGQGLAILQLLFLAPLLLELQPLAISLMALLLQPV